MLEKLAAALDRARERRAPGESASLRALEAMSAAVAATRAYVHDESHAFDGSRREVTAHAATGEELERLWAMWNALDENYEGYTKLRAGETAIVVLEPRSG